MEAVCEADCCIGCSACLNACPKGAISMVDDGRGNPRPAINQKLCINCGLCAKSCPVNHPVVLHRALTSFAAWARYHSIRESSSSGGIAFALSKMLFARGGKVYGAAFEKGALRLKCAHSEDDLHAFRGSKYVQCDPEMAYAEIKRDLRMGHEVLFISTPCQVAALKSFLREDNANLFTIDLICHGTPPFKYLEEHIDRMVNGKVWTSCRFRGQQDFTLQVFCNSERLFSSKANGDLYFSAFLESMLFRDECYRCPFAQIDRVGDLTIGDYWGLDREDAGIEYKGKISVVLPNTEKGRRLLNESGDLLNLVSRSLDEAVNPMQAQLSRPSIPHDERERFLSYCLSTDFDTAVAKTSLGKKVRIRKYKDRLKRALRLKPARKMLKRTGESIGIRLRRTRLHYPSETPCIIANNCMAGVIYHDLAWKFLSPTINSYMRDEDFFTFVSDIPYYLCAELREEKSDNNWPTGILLADSEGHREVRIEFMHYRTFAEAKRKWVERCSRVNLDRLIVLWEYYGDPKSLDMVKAFDQMPFDKLVIAHEEIDGIENMAETHCYSCEAHDGKIFDFKSAFGMRNLDDINYIDFINAATRRWLKNKKDSE